MKEQPNRRAPNVHPPLPVERALRPIAALTLALLAGCSSAQTAGAGIPAAGRPMWEQCSTAVTAWCHRQGQGDPTLDRDCEATTAREYGALADDAARQAYLRARACAL
jgi:hypothetical protein